MDRRRARRGSALVVSLFAVLLVGAFTASLLQLSAVVSRSQTEAVNRKLSFYMAEAGLAEAYAGMMVGKTGTVGSAEEPARFGHGLFWVETEDLGDDLVRVESTGMVAGGRAILSLVLRRNERSIGSLGLYSDAALTIPPGSRVDMYDSSVGPYVPPVSPTTAPSSPTSTSGSTGSTSGSTSLSLGLSSTSGGLSIGVSTPLLSTEVGLGAEGLSLSLGGTPATEAHAIVGSNASISVSGTAEAPTYLDADLVPGPEHGATVTGTVVVTGATNPALDTTALPPIAAPPIAMENGITHGGRSPLVVAAGDSAFEFLRLQSGADVILQGPGRFVIGELVVPSSANLTFDTSQGRIDLWVTRSLALASGGEVTTTTPDPGLVTLQIPTALERPAELAASGPFHGIVYAPQSTLRVGGAFEVFGSLVAERIDLTGPLRLHYDRHLATVANVSTIPSLWSWRIVELTSQTGSNPYATMGVDPATLPPPSRAHADQSLDILYLDLAGIVQVYAGLESGFDWSDVSRAIQVQRDDEPVPPAGIRVGVDLGSLLGF